MTAYRAGYSRAFTDERLAQQAQEAREQAERDVENARVHDAYLAGLEAEREGRRKGAAAAQDAALEPTCLYQMHVWLAEQPGQSKAVFNRDAWPHIRANLTSAEAIIAQEVAA